MKINKIFLGCMAASAMMLASCSSEESAVLPQLPEGEVFGTGSSLVTLSVNANTLSGVSRADNLPDISSGERVDALVFAVYTADNENGTYTLDKSFKQKETSQGKVNAGDGQVVLNVTTYPTTVTLATDPNKYYKVVFWAQNSTTTAFTTTDLTAVKVDYSEAKNNDELRDAFCATTSAFLGSAKGQEVVLHRPFAQINVGTSGADFANYAQNDKIFPNKTIAYSKIVLKGVANEINVLTDEIKGSTDATFNWEKIAAYVNVEVPTDKADAIEGVEGEQYLVVRLNDTKKGQSSTEATKGYLTSYPTVDENGDYLTETFKYLSMCYALVPATPTTNVNSSFQGEDPFASSVLTNVTVFFAENADGTDNTVNKDDDGKTVTTPGYAYISLDNVPVHRNWRTNILGGLKNTDPDDPDDETSIFSTTRICVHLCPIYDGEYTTVNSSMTWFHTEFPQYGNDEEEDTWHDGYHDNHDSGDAEEDPQPAPGA